MAPHRARTDVRISDLLALSYVPRWGIVPMLRDQSVADHSFRTAVIFVELADRMNIPITAWDLVMVLWHDGPESHSGDIPAPFKSKIRDIVHTREQDFCPWYDEPTAEKFSDTRVYEIFHAADLIEQYTWLRAWGHGPTATRASSLIYEKITEQITTVDNMTVIWAIIADINDEEGRYGSRNEASR